MLSRKLKYIFINPNFSEIYDCYKATFLTWVSIVTRGQTYSHLIQNKVIYMCKVCEQFIAFI